MRTLKESVLSGGAEAAFDNVEIFEKAKKWLWRYATVKGLKMNKDGTLDAEEVRFWAHADVVSLPEYVRFNYVKKYSVEGCQQWVGGVGSYPKKSDRIYFKDIWKVNDLSGFEGIETEYITFHECQNISTKDLKIPRNCKIGCLRIINCNHWTSHMAWCVSKWERQCKPHHIVFMTT